MQMEPATAAPAAAPRRANVLTVDPNETAEEAQLRADMESILAEFSDAELQEFHDDALKQLSWEFRTPEELTIRLPRLIENCNREHVDIRKRMAVLTQTQIAGAHTCLAQLKEGYQQLDGLRASFVATDESISKLQSVASCVQLRQLHHLRTNLGKIVEWSKHLSQIQDLNIDEMLEQRQLLEVYEVIKPLQMIRRDLRMVSLHERSYVMRLNETFMIVDGIIDKFCAAVLKEIEETGQAVLTVVDEIQNGRNDEEPADDEDDEKRRAVENDQQMIAAFREDHDIIVLQAALTIIDQERKNPLLSLQGGAESSRQLDVAPLDPTLVMAALRRSSDFVLFQIILGKIADPRTAVGDFIKALVDHLLGILTILEDFVGVLKCDSVPLVDCTLLVIHSALLDQISKLAMTGAGVSGKELVDCLRYLNYYARTCIEEGPLGQFYSAGDVRPTAELITKAAIQGVADYLVEYAGKTGVTFRRSSKVSDDDTGALRTDTAQDFLASVLSLLTAVTGNATVDILRSVAERFAQTLDTITRDVVAVLDFQTFQVELIKRDKRAERLQQQQALTASAQADKPPVGGPAAAPTTAPAASLSRKDEWVRFVCAFINDLDTLIDGATKLRDKCFGALIQFADDYGVEYDDPIECWIEDEARARKSELIDRLVDYVDVDPSGVVLEVMWSADANYVSGAAASQQAYPTTLYCETLKDYVKNIRTFIASDDRETFTYRLMSRCAASFMNRLAEALRDASYKRVKDFRTRLLEDCRMFTDAWQNFASKTTLCQKQFDTLRNAVDDGIGGLLTDAQLVAGQEAAAVALPRLLRQFDDMPLAFVERLLKLRDDPKTSEAVKAAQLFLGPREQSMAQPAAGGGAATAPRFVVVSLFGLIDRTIFTAKGGVLFGGKGMSERQKKRDRKRYELPDPKKIILDEPIPQVTVLQETRASGPVAVVSLQELLTQSKSQKPS